MKKSNIMNMESIAYYSGFHGLEVKTIEHGIEDYLFCVSGAWSTKQKCHKLKIYYDNSGAFVRLHGHRVKLDECIRMS